MATAQEIAAIYESTLGRAPDPEGAAYWASTGLSAAEIAQAVASSPEAKATQVSDLYQNYLGREADPEGAAYWQSQLASGANVDDVIKSFTRAADEDYTNFITQAITSGYGSNLARLPEQEGFQYWLSSAISSGLSAQQIQDAIKSAGITEQELRGITGGNTQFFGADLEADPWGGRLATRSIYDIPQNEADRINISYINGVPVQFVSPVTQQQYISNYGQDAWNAIAGDEVLSKPRVTEAVDRALRSGSMTQEEAKGIIDALKTAKEPADVRQILGIPQGAIVIDPVYGQQIGQDNNLKIALAEAAKRQAVLSAQDPGYYQASDVLGQAYLDAGLPWEFMSNTYLADTMMTQANKLTPQNFNQKVNELLKSLSGQYTDRFGGLNDMETPGLGQYYSETGLQPGFTPFGTEGTTFRSGVAGYVPQEQLPTGFQFGAPPVNATFQQYRPGAFQPEGVTTGGFITGYNANGTPIYSTYADPNQTVGNYVAPQTTQSFTTDLVNQILGSNPGLNYANQMAAQQPNLQAG
jgi:hypothetical protein